jgi:hypothetical protein
MELEAVLLCELRCDLIRVTYAGVEGDKILVWHDLLEMKHTRIRSEGSGPVDRGIYQYSTGGQGTAGDLDSVLLR